MKKVLITATVQSHICQFHKPFVEVLHDAGYEVHVAARDNLAEKNGLKLDFADKVFDIPFSRSPKSTDNIKAYKRLKKIIDNGGYDIVSCNTPMGGIVTRLAARKARKNGTKVFYTAHGFHFYKGAPQKNWLIFYPIEKFFARYTDKLITIVNEDYELAKKKFKCPVYHIHGVGVDSERFYPVSDETKQQLREKLNLLLTDFVVLCTGELNKNKNQSQLIKAISILKNKAPNIKVLLAGNGPNKQNLINLISDLGLGDNIMLLGYRTDLEKIIPAVDLVVSCSKREGLGLNVIEAMLCKKAVVATLNRGHKELIKNGENGFTVGINDINDMANKIYYLYNNSKDLLEFGENGYIISKKYSKCEVKKELSALQL